MKPIQYCPICKDECPIGDKGEPLKTCGKRRCRGLLTKKNLPPDYYKKLGAQGGIWRQ